MRIFLSWSGEQSRAVATALRDWVPRVIQSVTPWMSSVDIEKGARWFEEIGSHLESVNVGVICLTRANVSAPWILFEAGALSKVRDKAHVCTYLYGLEPTDVSG